MADPFEQLRKQAAQKMDAAIKVARDEYKAEVAKINALRSSLGYENPMGLRTRKRIGDMLAEHYPSDRTFTVDDLIANVSASYPNERFKRQSVRTAMQEHKEKGIVRRVAKEKNGIIVWAVAELAVVEKPFAAMSIGDVIAEVLLDSNGMRPAELVVAMQTMGFRREDDPVALMRQVSKSLYMNPRRFVKDGIGKWALIGNH